MNCEYIFNKVFIVPLLCVQQFSEMFWFETVQKSKKAKLFKSNKVRNKKKLSFHLSTKGKNNYNLVDQ